MSSNNHQLKRKNLRIHPRIHTVREISVQYEGRTEEVALRVPDVSTHGMFFNTATHFPEGAVLHLRFRLALTGVEIETRCEVRYCLPGVGVGVEFIGISPEAVRKITREIQMCKRTLPRKKTPKLA